MIKVRHLGVLQFCTNSTVLFTSTGCDLKQALRIRAARSTRTGIKWGEYECRKLNPHSTAWRGNCFSVSGQPLEPEEHVYIGDVVT